VKLYTVATLLLDPPQLTLENEKDKRLSKNWRTEREFQNGKIRYGIAHSIEESTDPAKQGETYVQDLPQPYTSGFRV
jgi:hypothetical protein